MCEREKRIWHFFVDSCSKAERILEKHDRSIPEIGVALDKAKEYLANIDTLPGEGAQERCRDYPAITGWSRPSAEDVDRMYAAVRGG
jgi:hypothetical protein